MKGRIRRARGSHKEQDLKKGPDKEVGRFLDRLRARFIELPKSVQIEMAPVIKDWMERVKDMDKKRIKGRLIRLILASPFRSELDELVRS